MLVPHLAPILIAIAGLIAGPLSRLTRSRVVHAVAAAGGEAQHERQEQQTGMAHGVLSDGRGLGDPRRGDFRRVRIETCPACAWRTLILIN
jgi:hypothetical protein